MEIMENNKGGKSYVLAEVQDTINHTPVCLSVRPSVGLRHVF